MTDECHGPAILPIRTILVYNFSFSFLMVCVKLSLQFSIPLMGLLSCLQVWIPRAPLPIPISILNIKVHLIFHPQANLQPGPKGLEVREDFY